MRFRVLIPALILFLALGAAEARAEFLKLGVSTNWLAPNSNGGTGPDVAQAWREFVEGARFGVGFVLTDYDEELGWDTGNGVRVLWEHPWGDDRHNPDWYLNVDVHWIDTKHESNDADGNDLRVGLGLSRDWYFLTETNVFSLTTRVTGGGVWARFESDNQSGWYVSADVDLRIRLESQLTLTLTPGIDYFDSSQFSDEDDSFISHRVSLALIWRF